MVEEGRTSVMKKILIAIVSLAVVSVDAATLTVTSNADSGAGSFRAALEDAFDIMMDTDDIIDLSSYEKGKEILSKADYGVQF